MFSFLLSQDYPVLGSSQSLDFMTWNVKIIQNIIDKLYMVDIINQINVDIIAFQEIESQNSFNNLINQLNGNWIDIGQTKTPIGVTFLCYKYR